MDKESLLARRKQAEDNYNALQNQRVQKEQEMSDIDTQMAKLQGEWGVLGELLDKVTEVGATVKASKASPAANVIDATGATK